MKKFLLLMVFISSSLVFGQVNKNNAITHVSSDPALKKYICDHINDRSDIIADYLMKELAKTWKEIVIGDATQKSNIKKAVEELKQNCAVVPPLDKNDTTQATLDKINASLKKIKGYVEGQGPNSYKINQKFLDIIKDEELLDYYPVSKDEFKNEASAKAALAQIEQLAANIKNDIYKQITQTGDITPSTKAKLDKLVIALVALDSKATNAQKQEITILENEAKNVEKEVAANILIQKIETLIGSINNSGDTTISDATKESLKQSLSELTILKEKANESQKQEATALETGANNETNEQEAKKLIVKINDLITRIKTYIDSQNTNVSTSVCEEIARYIIIDPIKYPLKNMSQENNLYLLKTLKNLNPSEVETYLRNNTSLVEETNVDEVITFYQTHPKVNTVTEIGKITREGWWVAGNNDPETIADIVSMIDFINIWGFSDEKQETHYARAITVMQLLYNKALLDSDSSILNIYNGINNMKEQF